jgi:hypothetical protein
MEGDGLFAFFVIATLLFFILSLPWVVLKWAGYILLTIWILEVVWLVCKYLQVKHKFSKGGMAE